MFWTPPQLTAPTEEDGINSSLCHGFIFDFCGVEVDRMTGAVRIDKYVTMHDCGRVLHPGMVAGQVTGGFAHALGAALYEEYAYADDGSFISGTFADYLLPTSTEVPAPLILHFESPSPFTPLGAKGVGEGNCMSTPVCLANAVADALGVAELDLPLTPAKLAALIYMKPASFDYLRAETLAEAHAALAAEGSDAAVIAGGQSLVPLLSMRMARPKLVVDIMWIAGLGGIFVAGQCDPCRRGGAPGRIAGMAGIGGAPALAGAGAAVGRALADPRTRHGVRIDRARRSERRAAALSPGAPRQCRSFFPIGAPQRPGARLLHRVDVDGAPRRRADRGGVFSLCAARNGLCVPRVRAPARRLRHRGLRGGRDR